MTKATILRRWGSRIRTKDRPAYVAYVRSTGGDDYSRTPGNLGFQMLLRDMPDGTTEIETLSWWTSVDAIVAFAGEDYQRARYYPEDDHFLLAKPELVTHFEIVVDARDGGSRQETAKDMSRPRELS
jgi:heme-degrading monooxygenase HmoA